MRKIVKLKLEDIENIVKKTINESEFEDSPETNDYENMGPKKTMLIGKGEDGRIYAIDSETGDILGVK
jgi:hypothetical protein